MTKLPQTIKVKINIFTGQEADKPNTIPVGRCEGKTTALALMLLGRAQLHGISFGFDEVGHNPLSNAMARNLEAKLYELTKSAGLEGFTFKVMMLEDFRGYKGSHEYAALDLCYKSRDYGVAVFFNPIKEVTYDLRK